MDCVRVSDFEGDNQVWNGEYDNVSNISSEDGCRQYCVSDRFCKAWKFDKSSNVCSISHHVSLPPHAYQVKFPVKSGFIICAKQLSMLMTLFWVFLIMVVCFGVWWLLRRCCR